MAAAESIRSAPRATSPPDPIPVSGNVSSRSGSLPSVSSGSLPSVSSRSLPSVSSGSLPSVSPGSSLFVAPVSSIEVSTVDITEAVHPPKRIAEEHVDTVRYEYMYVIRGYVKLYKHQQ